MKTLILALGNPILSDDGVALEVADRLAGRLANTDTIKSSAATMDIIPGLAGYERLVVVDAVQRGSSPPGTVYRLSLKDFADTVRPSSPHDINFATAFSMADQWGYDIPEDIRIYAIEVVELSKFAEGCTPQVAEKLEEIVEYIFNDLADESQSN